MNARHRNTTMDTLISLGVVAATGWSLWALIWGGATDSHNMSGMVGMAESPHVYFEVAVSVTVFLLAGRYFEARAKRRAGVKQKIICKTG